MPHVTRPKRMVSSLPTSPEEPPLIGLDLLRAEATSSPAWYWIAQVLRHMVMAELEITEDLMRHAISVGTARHSSGGLVEPHEHRGGRAVERAPVVYYMLTGNRVKIGTSIEIGTRCRTLRPEALLTVERGGYAVEKQRHQDFSSLRVSGEWFRNEDPLVTYVELVASRFEGEFGMPFKKWKIAQDLPTYLW